MSDDLLVGGGGSISVATVTLFSHAQRLERLEGELEACARTLAAMDAGAAARLDGAAPCRPALEQAERGIEDAGALLRLAAARSGILASGLQVSAGAYGVGEAAITALGDRLAGDLAAGLGLLAARLGVVLLPGALVAGARAVLAHRLASMISPDATRTGTDAAGRWLSRYRPVLSDPRFVQFTRLAVMSADDLAAGAAGLPSPIVRILGDGGLGVSGLDTAARAAAAGAAAFGALRETPVRTTPVSSAVSTPAEGFADRAARVPSGSAQVRIDRYSTPGQPDRFEVYLGGTADFSAVSGSEPWDLTSNITAIAGGESGSYRAAADALDQAGVDARSPMLITGYSQGGLVAAQLAASGDYDVRGLYTLGAPSGQVDVPRHVPWVAVEHTDDIVPALGGTWATADPVLVRREVFSDGPLPSGPALPAHAAERYRETAALIDAADERRLRAAGAEFAGIAGAGGVAGVAGGVGIAGEAVRVESTWFRAVRVP